MIALTVPENIMKELSKIKVPGKKVIDDEYHITLFYFEKSLKPDDVFKISQAAYDIAKRFEPFLIKGQKITTFPEGPDGVPIIVKIESDGLVEFRKKLAKHFDQKGIEYSKKWPEFNPHMTLSYANKTIEDRKINASWTTQYVTLFSGDEMDDGIIVDLPFKHMKRASNRFELIDTHCSTFYKLAQRKKGRSLAEAGYEYKYVVIYRAAPASVDTFYSMDYVTRSKKFALGHAEHNAVVMEDSQVVLSAMVLAKDVYEAENPGEYFYDGPERKGTVVAKILPEQYE